MHVLICDDDIFGGVGGGQTVYQNLVRLLPDYIFYYFAKREPRNHPRPPNARAVPLVERFAVGQSAPDNLHHFQTAFVACMNRAYSVATAFPGVQFDVADAPDYSTDGLFIREALRYFDIPAPLLAIAMHGNVSTTTAMHWPGGPSRTHTIAELRAREHLQFRTADVRYAISKDYADTWRRRAHLAINEIDPLCIIETAAPSMHISDQRLPDLVFVGRRERCKGPDLFADLIWWIPRDKYSRARIIGYESLSPNNVGSQTFLERAARLRKIDLDIINGRPRTEMLGIFQEKVLLCITSRSDTFNLVALEALLRGCPTVVSESAGIVRFLREHLPFLPTPLPIIGMDCAREGARTMSTILSDYDRYRRELVSAIRSADLSPNYDTVREIYRPAGEQDVAARATVRDIASRLLLLHEPQPSPVRGRLIRSIFVVDRLGSPAPRRLFELTKQLRRVAGYNRGQWRYMARQVVENSFSHITSLDPKSVAQAAFLLVSPRLRREIASLPERSATEVDGKIARLNYVASRRYVDRVRIFREAMRLERKRGNDLVAATYGLRLMRWLGEDRFSDLPFVLNTLDRFGYKAESEVANAMFGSFPDRQTRQRAILDTQLARHTDKPSLPLQFLDDRRPHAPARVAVIVSLYNAAQKLPTFIRMLRQQTMVAQGAVEFIFVDSGSPTNEYGVFKQMMAEVCVPAAYARSAERESIQGAWNRGIQLSRADYLTFLGVDEGIHPQCLEILAGHLDRDDTLDWIMADSIVTKVDRHGVFDTDVMSYDRSGYRQDLHYLECAYLSYVGGLYRRRIHDRVGYYDETFRAAGDTEFKNRVLPFIKSKHVSLTLGVFNDYPEARTTAHPRAEIEDLRAWYLHRTVAGLSYAFDRSDTERALWLLRDTVHYRKSYLGHTSTDIELGVMLSRYLAGRCPEALFARANQELSKILHMYRRLELLPFRSGGIAQLRTLAQLRNRLRKLQREHKRLLEMDVEPCYEIFNDNRYEQHWWPWAL